MNKRSFSKIDEDEDYLPLRPKKSKRVVMDSSTSNLFEGPHPFLMDHVVENILEHLCQLCGKEGEKEVLKSRLINSTWMDAGTKIFKRMDNREITFGFNDTRKLANFIETMRNTNILLIRRFRFDANFFISDNEDLFREFLQQFGPSITHLSIMFGNNFTMTFDPEKFTRFNFAKLKCLSFKCSYLTTRLPSLGGDSVHQSLDKQFEGVLTLLERLISYSPRLQSFDFCVPSGHFQEHDNRFGDLLTKRLPKGVTDLKLTMVIKEGSLRELTELGLKLKTLHVNLFGSKLLPDSLVGFLESQRNTLENLNIADTQFLIAERLSFPVMPLVETLDIKCGYASTFNFIKAFPHLHKLILRNERRVGGPEPQTGNENSAGIQESVKEIELKNETASSVLIRRIAQLFPNIEKLQLKIDEMSLETLETVFEVLPNLLELSIEFPHFFGNLAMDTVFTGIPIAQCRRMLGQRFQSVERLSASIDLSAIRRKPNLSNLTRLRKLSIKSESYAAVVTNVTAQFALLQMENLEELQMEQFNISTEYFTRLRERFHLTEPESLKKEKTSYYGSPVIGQVSTSSNNHSLPQAFLQLGD